MMVLPVMAGIFVSILGILFILCSIALILIVLVQKGRGGGLSGAFGGAMASGVLGSKTGDFLTWITIILAGVFLGLAVLMARFNTPSVGNYGTEQTTQTDVNAVNTNE